MFMTENTKESRLLRPDRVTALGIDITALKGVTLDSRCVEEGFLFAALEGERVDGRKFIGDALKKGATVILTDTGYEAPEELPLDGAKLILSDNPRQDLSYIAAQFFAPLPGHVVAVTGTNGKSSVVHFAEQLWQKEGVHGVMMGTLNNSLTTPDPVTLFKTLGQLKQQKGVTHVAMEASSHGLAQHRVDGAPIKVGAFTNFTQDHLDYHIDMDSYFLAKMRLFEELLPIDGTAVLNADVPAYKPLKDVCKRRGIRVLSYGTQATDLRLRSRQVAGVTQDVSLDVMGKHFDLNIPFVGAFQIMNMLCALGCLIASSPEDKARIDLLVHALPTLKGVPGRLQHVSDTAGIYNGYVDYAHTPDALETVLKALHPHTDKKLICVFGCGGDRDALKRPQMGEIAARLADISIITDDNPRSEDPVLIREQIEAGIEHSVKQKKQIENISGRREAIRRAAQLLCPGDILLLAGKGHEQGQKIGAQVLPFDDVQELRQALDGKESYSSTSDNNNTVTKR